MDLTEAKYIKKRWQDYTEELYKKDFFLVYVLPKRALQKGSSQPRWSRWCDLSPRARHPGMQSQMVLGSITTNKASGGDGSPVEVFQILKDDAVKVLHSIC